MLRGRPGARLHGRLFPSGARGSVVLQHVVGGRWKWVARVTSKADGSFRFPVRASGGRWRATWRGAGPFLAARSPELRVGARSLAWTPTDPLAAREWNLAAVNAFAYADVLPVLQDAPVTVAIIDSGIDRTSPDLTGAVPLAPIDEARDPTTSLVHGTAVAGIIAADANNGIGGARRRRPLRAPARLPRRRRRRRRSRGRGAGDPQRRRRRRARHQPLARREPRSEEPGARRVLARRARRRLVRRQPGGRGRRGGRELAVRDGRLRELAGRAPTRHRRLLASISGSPGRRSRTPTRSTTTSQRPARASSPRCRARSRRPARRSTPRPGRRRHRGHRARHLVRGAARQRGGRGAAGAPPRAHAEPGPVDPRAHGAPPRRRERRRARCADGLRAARRHGRGQARGGPAVGRAAARSRASRTTSPPTLRRSPPRSASPMRSPTSETTGATSTRSSCDAARRCRSAPRACRWAAISVSTSPSTRPTRATSRARWCVRCGAGARPSAKSLLRVRNTSLRDGYYLVQATVRRGWGAYRLRWNVTPSQQ